MTRSRGWCSVGEASLSTSLMEGDDDLCWEERGTEAEEERQGGGGGVEEEARERAWEAFSSGFREVQGVLEENRLLISQVNDNHSSRLPENLTKNVALIRQINANISKVLSLYSRLSANFSTLFSSASSSSNTSEISSKKK